MRLYDILMHTQVPSDTGAVMMPPQAAARSSVEPSASPTSVPINASTAPAARAAATTAVSLKSSSSPDSSDPSVGNDITVIVIASMACGGAIVFISIVIVALVVGRRRFPVAYEAMPDGELAANGQLMASMTKMGGEGNGRVNFVPMPAPNREAAWDFSNQWAAKNNAAPVVIVNANGGGGVKKRMVATSSNQVQPFDDEVELLEDLPRSSPVKIEMQNFATKKTRKQRARAYQEIEEMPEEGPGPSPRVGATLQLMDALAEEGLDYEETARWSNNLTKETIAYLDKLRS